MRKPLAFISAFLLYLPGTPLALSQQVMPVMGSTWQGPAAGPPIAVLQTCPDSTGMAHTQFTTTVTCAWTHQNLTSGSHIVVFATINITLDPTETLSISDGTNSYTAAGFTYRSDTLGAKWWNVWCAPNTLTNKPTITVTSQDASNADFYMGAIELSNASCTVDTTASTQSTGLTTPSFSTGTANDIVIATLTGGNGGTGPAVGLIGGGTPTLIGSTSSGAGNPGWEYLVTTGTLTGATASFTSATGTVYPQAVAYKP
jgi:hypothetical protein